MQEAIVGALSARCRSLRTLSSPFRIAGAGYGGQMRFGVLGSLAVWTDEGEPVAIPERKVRALLANLLVNRVRPVSADRLIDDLWGDRLPVNPAGALQLKVSRLRQALDRAEPGGRALVVSRAPGYLLEVSGEAVDEGRFSALADRARASGDPRTGAGLLAQALALWRGPALADFTDEEFARPAIARLEEQRLVALEEQAEARLALGEHGPLAGELGDMVAHHPLRERLRAAYMLALYLAGRQAEALSTYRDLRDRLRQELGLNPGPEPTAVHQKILRQDPALRDAPGFRDAPGPRPLTNLPAQMTELVGRQRAVAEVGALLERHRLVTLTGPGGVGKTRLALQTATELTGNFPDGVWLVELAAVEPHGTRPLAESIMTVLSIQRSTLTDPADRLADALRTSRMLLVLDNCEHVVEQAARLTGQLLRTASGLRVLATSREPLAISGETVWAVPPLVPPGLAAGTDRDTVREYSAVQLFVARAGPGFSLTGDNAEAVAVLCRRLDGIPLALELAATRVRALGVHELVARLNDRFRLLVAGYRGAPPRQRTLRAVIDWSWNLLTEPERLVLRRLSATADGCTLEAAERICADDRLDVLDVVARLADRSLVVVLDTADGPRYRLLESIAAYGLERLHEAGEYEMVRRRHRSYYTELAELAEPRLRGHDQRQWLSRLDTESANMASALDDAIRSHDAPMALRLVNALAWYWFLRGRLGEARRSLDAALAIDGDCPPAVRAAAAAWQSGITVLAGQRIHQSSSPPLDLIADPDVRATAQWFHGFVASDYGDPSTSEALVGGALARFHALGNRWGVAAALSTRAKLAMIRGDLATVERDASKSLAIFQELGDNWGRLQATEWLGALAETTGDHVQAARLHRTGLHVAEELGLWPQAADALSWLGRSTLKTGDPEPARTLFEEAIRMATEHGYKPGQIFAEIGLGLTARKQGDLDRAETHMRNVLQWNRHTGSEPDIALTTSLSELGFIAEERGDPEAAQALHLQALAAARQRGDMRTVTDTLIGLAGAQALAGHPQQAARLLGAAEKAETIQTNPIPPAERTDLIRVTAATKRALGEPSFAIEFQLGLKTGPDQAHSLPPAATHLERPPTGVSQQAG
jgi:predicted ATPase/DNA-binding SARP family transcriptional activator